MKKIIGLTGPTGAGKTSVGRIAQEKGIKVIDCDLYARKAVEKGTSGLCALIKTFGEDILNADGTLCRKALAKKAFSSKKSTELLNATLLPFIKELVIAQMDTDKVLLDAPTLFESGLDKMCDKTIAVLSDDSIRLSRITKRDNLTREAALLRMNAGKSDDFFINNADFVIYNNCEEEKFSKEVSSLLDKIFGGNNNE